MTPGRPTYAVLLLLALALAGAGAAAAQLPPDARWASFDTEHFRVHLPAAELEPVARRAARHAEAAYAQLAAAFVEPPRGRIDLVVADNVDLANGYAVTFPTNRVVVFAHPPVDQPSLAFFDDWLQLVITHELTHIFHLDHAGGVWRPLRRLFGRTATFFPHVFTPGWVVEGLAVYYESRFTRAGRLRGTHHEMVLRAAILEDAFFSIDRATGAPVAWPGGSARYVYGSLFVAHLAERYGAERAGDFVRDFGRRLVPYRLDASARRVFGTSFTAAWAEWQDSLRAHYTALADSLRAAGLTEPEILTPEGRFALHPRVAPGGGEIAYASYTEREEPSTRLVREDGRRIVLAPRNTLGPLSWFPGGEALLTAELEFQDPYRIYADLVRVERSGRRTRLTDGARLREPDLHPDGRRVAAVGHAPGTNVLVLADLETGEVRPIAEPTMDVHWALPRWSPDGTRIAAGRWRAGGFFDVVVLDSAGAVLHEPTRDRAVNTDPAWSPDGRFLLFSSDRSGIANLYAYDLERDSLFQVTSLLTGAFQPDVSPDGEWIAFSYYGANGYHVARIPFDPAAWRPAPPVLEAFAGGPVEPGSEEEVGGPLRRYSSWPSLAPAGWLPLLDAGTALGFGFGATLDGEDVIGRHLWNADALLYPHGRRLEARIGYRYRGWGNPLLDLVADQEWQVWSDSVPAVTQAGDTLWSALFRRDQRVVAQVQHQWPRWRRVFWLGGGADARQLEFAWDDSRFTEGVPLRDFPLDLGLRLFGGYSSVRGYGYSISPDDGVQLQLSAEARRYARVFAGEDAVRGYSRLIGRGIGFRGLDFGGFARHVLATRLAAGVETGASGPGFGVGGISGTGLQLGLGYGIDAVQRTFPVRGYPAGAQQGDRALSGTLEYRFPLLLVERGVRAWPFFLNRVWGDLFLDAGGAWCTVDCERRFTAAPRGFAPLAAAGAETALSLVYGYGARLVLRGGVAAPLRDIPTAGEPVPRPGARVYLVAGRSF